MSMTTWLYVAAILTFGVGIAHSVLGEKFILMRLFRETTFAARTLRFAWHLTSVAWWGFGGLLLLAARGSLAPSNTLKVLAATMLVTALVILVSSRGRHLAWPIFAAIGLIAWFA